jgi:hypothetical protein
MPLYLGEREVGFEIEMVGFPSIDGCHAVALETKEGFYGFHNLGGSAKATFDERAKSFMEFVTTAFVQPTETTALWGVCFHDKRGYEGNDKLKAWKDEMKAFAKALDFKGPVKGYNLGATSGWPNKPDNSGLDSAYVELRKANNAVTLHVKPWQHMKFTKAAIQNKANHKTTDGKGGVKAIATQIYGTIAPKTGGLQAVAPNALITFNA